LGQGPGGVKDQNGAIISIFFVSSSKIIGQFVIPSQIITSSSCFGAKFFQGDPSSGITRIHKRQQTNPAIGLTNGNLDIRVCIAAAKRKNVNSCPVQFSGRTSLFLNLRFFTIFSFIRSIYMMEYLKNIILIENRTLFHVKKSVKMQNLKKIATIGHKKCFMEPRVARGCT
jgi:hypothetical protein